MELRALLETLIMSATMTMPPAGTLPTPPSDLFFTTLFIKIRSRFGQHTCDSPLALVTSAADFMASYNPPDGGKVDSELKLKMNIKAHKVRFVLWTGDDTVHCDDAYSDKDTVSVLNLSDDDWITVVSNCDNWFPICHQGDWDYQHPESRAQ